MRIIAISDIHGRRKWKKIIEQEKEFDKVVFVGDYFDSREGISYDTQIANFKEILEFKQKYPDKVILLIGNHDAHYIKGWGEEYSGFDFRRFNDINEVLQPAIDSKLLQVCHRHGKYIFSHAGITKTWANEYGIEGYNLTDKVNQLFYTNREAFKFDGFDPSGDDITQGPLWVRIPSLLSNPLDGYTFVIGHTTMKQLQILNNVICIDTLGTSGEYLLIEDRKEIIQKILD